MPASVWAKFFQEQQNRLSVEGVRMSRARGLEMSRCWCRVKPADEQILVPLRSACPECGRAMRIRYSNRRAIVSLRGLVRLRLKIRRCEDRNCGRYHQAWRPEAEAALVLPQHEFGLDVIALVGAPRAPQRPGDPPGAEPAWRSASAASCSSATTSWSPARRRIAR